MQPKGHPKAIEMQVTSCVSSYLFGERDRDEGVENCEGPPLSAAVCSPNNFLNAPLVWGLSRYFCFMLSWVRCSPFPKPPFWGYWRFIEEPLSNDLESFVLLATGLLSRPTPLEEPWDVASSLWYKIKVRSFQKKSLMPTNMPQKYNSSCYMSSKSCDFYRMTSWDKLTKLVTVQITETIALKQNVPVGNVWIETKTIYRALDNESSISKSLWSIKQLNCINPLCKELLAVVSWFLPFQ